MITILCYIINKCAPIINFVGLIGLLTCFIYGDNHVLIIGLFAVVIGLIFGIKAYKLDIPPRWSWSRSRNHIFDFSVAAVLGYTWSITAWVFAIYFIIFMIDGFQNGMPDANV